MGTTTKNWDRYVIHAEEVARGAGFRALRDRILERAGAGPPDDALDIGAGTGLLALSLAERVRHVWAVDISAAMTSYLETKAGSAGLENLECVTASAVSLPLVDASVDLVVSNYCFHHLDDRGKERALAEVARVLRPGGRLVFGDMMFRVSVTDARDRRVVASKVRGMLRKGPGGIVRLAKNGARIVDRRWERPARADWWDAAMRRAGFIDVDVELLPHEGGIASARRG